MRKVLLAVGVILCSITAAQSREAPVSGRFPLPSAGRATTRSNNPSTPPGAESLAANSEEALAITSYSPKFGPPGTVITIQGTGFGPSSASSYLSVLSPLTGTWTIWATTSWSDTEIVASVPATMRDGLVYLNATVNGIQSVGTEPFTVGVPPNIGSYSPLSGLPGTVLKINGTGFGSTQGRSYIAFQSSLTNIWNTWKPTSWSDTEIVVPVPSSVPPGKVYLSVTVNGLANIGTYPFTVGIPPHITSYSPQSGLPETVLTIHGTGFGKTQGGSNVSVQSALTSAWTTWKAISWSDTEIAVSVPDQTANGQVYFSVNVKGLQSIGTYGFRVGIPPVISSYSPLFGPPGTVVTIHGTGFGQSQGGSYLEILSLVTGTYTTWTPTSWSDSEIVVPVPTKIPLGKIYLIVEVDEVQSFGWDAFTVGVPPLITSYSPFSGPPTTLLTIHGTGFGAIQGSSYVSVLSPITNAWTTWTAPISWNDTEIIIPVPVNTPNGRVYLYVTVNGLAIIGTYPYTVGTPPVITSYSPFSGPPETSLTIHGTGFGTTQGDGSVSVQSALTNAWTTWAPTSWSDTEIVVPVPSTMPLGKVYLSVAAGGLAGVGTYPFSVGIPPTIANYSPLSSLPGALLTIHGTGFGSSQGNSYVSVQSASTNAWTTWTPTSWSDTEIVVPVPATMPNELVYLSVTVGGLANIGTYPYNIQ
jgi:IPT/TIG domain